MLINSLAYLGFHDIRDIGMMTLAEYQLRMEAYQLKRVDQKEFIATMAFYNQLVQSTTGGKNPKPKYDRLSKIFNREEEENRVFRLFGDDSLSSQSKESDGRSIADSMKKFYALKKAGKIDKTAWKKINYRKGGG
ncbi:hypothetical protein [Limosilactobacillus vaginalis]|uniref:hypothetical protein n=1 Tax=Limosilactobacillus vaginalis TaxID=1633 RepID=UPI0024B9B5AD|nr:hypothetical protein [Limosilactobacillus vaginalis]